MYKELALKFVDLAQLYQQNIKKEVKIFLMGEEAVLMQLSMKCSGTDVTPSDISESLNVSSARVAVSLNRLEDKGFITREIDLEDRRKIIIKLTKEGSTEASKIKEKHLGMFQNMLEKIGMDEANKLYESLSSVLNVVLEEGSSC